MSNKNKYFQLRHRLYYLLKAKNEYSVHSPMIFDFYTKTIKAKKNISTHFANHSFWIMKDLQEILSYIEKENNFLIRINDIHKNKKNYSLWKNICDIKNLVFVSIDFFSFGLIIKDQRLIKRQHYILKTK